MLPTARPASPERAIQSPSASAGANTCTTAMALLHTPAATQAAKKAVISAGVGRNAAAPSASPAAATSRPAAERLMAHGSTPTALDSSAAAATSSSAATSAAERDAAPRRLPAQAGARAAIASPHKPSAAAWLNSVGDGGRLYAIRPGSSAASKAMITLDRNSQVSDRRPEGEPIAIALGGVRGRTSWPGSS